MLGNTDAAAMIAVKDLEAARLFYADTLGLTETGGLEGELIAFQSGNTTVNVYRPEFAGSNKATALAWTVEDIASTVTALRAKGVAFERYDTPGMTQDGELSVAGNFKTAWFKDPDGNILNIASGSM